jgi:hypothetical protein
MKKTIITHFYNEEYLLPWWLKHHSRFFDDGILIDYNSNDNSCDIIKQICPNWTIIKTKNKYFDSAIIDREVSFIEKAITGWKICLNITEFLVGDYSIMDTLSHNRYQLLLGNYVFVDNKKEHLDQSSPLYNQITNGFHQDERGISNLHHGDRALRSLHNYNIRYPGRGGRHFGGLESTQNLIIFYYGYLLNIKEMIHRKTQIQHNMSAKEYSTLKSKGEHPNIVTDETFKERIIKYQLPKCKDMQNEIKRLITLQENYVNNKNNYMPSL